VAPSIGRKLPPLASYEVISGRGPFTLACERHILERHAIDVLVARASGGRQRKRS
jgi:precorrin-6A/cobalt-precorrin-6A reductase